MERGHTNEEVLVVGNHLQQSTAMESKALFKGWHMQFLRGGK